MASLRPKVEFGDFQTPQSLADRIARRISKRGRDYSTIVEPTCGEGNLLIAGLAALPSLNKGIACELNAAYADAARARLDARRQSKASVTVHTKSFFDLDWSEMLADNQGEILVLANPPWVTNSTIGSIGGENLPEKSNFQGHRGLDARTGKANFDISEWILISLYEALRRGSGTIAVICKTSVARRFLAAVWGSPDDRITAAAMYAIDAKREFNASVDACVLVVDVSHGGEKTCEIFADIDAATPTTKIGFADGRIFSDLPAYLRTLSFAGNSATLWRSGVKHDCSAVMELRVDGARYLNGLGEVVDLEPDYLFPMLKCSDLANGRLSDTGRRMLVPQRATGDETAQIRSVAPKTYEYLCAHGAALDGRGSSIYRNRPRFSVFGIGDYAFSLWKVAISGLHKKLEFSVLAPVDGRPIVLDDTCYFIPCESQDDAVEIASALNSDVARDFFRARIFWDAKRPVTADVLRQLNLEKLMGRAGKSERQLSLLA